MKYYLVLPPRSKNLLILIGIILVVITTITWIEAQLRPAIHTIAEARVNHLATTTISQVVAQVMEEETTQTPLIHTTKNEQGKIILVQPDTIRFNAITAHITEELQTQLERMQDIPITMPLGQIWGNTIIANYGPQIPIYMKPIGKILVQPQDRFEHVGINQTKHQMYLDIAVTIQIAVPLSWTTTTVQTAIPLTEYVIVGDVPSTYIELPQNFLK